MLKTTSCLYFFMYDEITISYAGKYENKFVSNMLCFRIYLFIFIITTIYINSGLSADVADRVWPRLLSFYFSLLYTPFL